MSGTKNPSISDPSVSGGAGGTAAKFDDLLDMSKVTDEVGHESLATAMAGHKYLVDADVLASALLNPGGVAAFEASMVSALDGPSGLTVTSGAISLRGAAIKAAKETYEFTEAANEKLFETSRWFAGAALASNPLAALAAGGVLTAATAADVYLNYDGDWQKWLLDHPGVVDEVIATAPGALSALGLPSTVESTLDLLASTYDDGKAETVTVAKNQPDDPPDNLAEVVDGLHERNTKSDQTNIDVRVVKKDGEITGYIVDIPGTKDWPLPGSEESANDLGVNVDAMAGNNTVLQQGIEDALQRAGADRTGAPVMLVGHSQGGIVAAESAGDLQKSGYNVSHVMTAGSPIGRADIPDNVQVLAMENNNDIVPHLDATDNPESANVTTVKFDNNTGTFGGNHAIGGDPANRSNYGEAAEGLDQSTNPSVIKYRESLDPFLNGDPEQSQINTYRVAREGVDDDENPSDVQND